MQVKFVEEYLKDGNLTQSAIRAGYSEKAAHNQGYRLMKHDGVKKYLKQRQDELRQELQQEFVSAASSAKKVMFQILNDKNASNKDRITVAKDFLDRAGFVPTAKSEITGVDGGAIHIVFKDPETG